MLYGGYARGWRAARRRRARARLPGDHRARRGSAGASDNPAFRQVFTSRFIPGGTRSRSAGSTSCAARRRRRRDRGRAARGARHVDVTDLLGAGAGADPRPARPRRRRRSRRGGPLPRRRHPGRPVRRAGLEEPHPARERAGLGALPRGRPRLRGARGAAAAARTPPSPRSRAREREILALITEGLGNAEIARAPLDQREDRAQPHLERLRQARRVDAGAGDRVRARPRLPVGSSLSWIALWPRPRALPVPGWSAHSRS